MGTDTIPARSGGQTITAQFFNVLRSVLGVDQVPRNSSGVPTDLAGSIGTSTYRFLSAFAQKYNLGAVASGLSIEEDSGAIVVKVNSTEVFRLSTTELLTTGIDFADNIITRDALKNDVVSSKSSSVNFNTTSVTFVDVTNGTVTFTRTGKPVLLYFEGDIRLVGQTTTRVAGAETKLIRTSTDLITYGTQNFQEETSPANTYVNEYPGGCMYLDTTTGTGSTTYKMQARCTTTGCEIQYSGKFVAVEL